MPPTTQTAKTISTEPTFWIMVRGTKKTPLPITVPTTMEAAAHGPRSRRSSTVGVGFGIRFIPRQWWIEAGDKGVLRWAAAPALPRAAADVETETPAKRRR